MRNAAHLPSRLPFLFLLPMLAFLLVPVPPSEGQSAGAADSTARPTGTGDGSVILELVTEPDEADVFLNQRFYGSTPLQLDDLDAGTYLLQIRKRGFHEETRWIELRPDSRLTMNIDLEPITGYLSVEMSPEDAELILDGDRMKERVAELPVGSYLLRVTAFGYEPYLERITIREDRTTRVRAELEPAPFRISGLSPGRAVFNPRNPGALSRLRISFEVTGPGSGEAVITGPAGDTVFRREFPAFTEREQSFVWEGTGTGGEPLPEGEYRITVSGSGSVAGTAAGSREIAAVGIDYSRELRYRSVLTGISGSLLAGSAESLPEGSFQASSLFLFPLSAGDGSNDGGGSGLVSAGGRYSPIGGVELDLAAHLIVRGRDGVDGSAGIGAKAVLFRSAPYDVAGGSEGDPGSEQPVRSIEAAASIRGIYSSREEVEGITATAGGYLGLPLTFRYGNLRLLLHPEIGISPYDPSESPYREGVFVRGYLRGGLVLDAGPLSTGVSAAAGSIPFSDGFSFRLPVILGWELHGMVPGTLLNVSLAVLAAVGDGDPSFTAGAGFGIVY